jgi:hypothetical protein
MINPFSIRLPSQIANCLAAAADLAGGTTVPDGIGMSGAGAEPRAFARIHASAKRATPSTDLRERPKAAPAADSPAAIVVSPPSAKQHAAASICSW